MRCLDCAATDLDVVAVGICWSCGAGVCLDHAVVTTHRLTRVGALVPDPPARRLLCPVCATAHQHATGDRRHVRAGPDR